MADLPLLQSGRVEAAGIPGAVLPTVNAPQVDYVGLKAGAQYQSNVAPTFEIASDGTGRPPSLSAFSKLLAVRLC